MSSARKDAMEAALRIAGGAALRPPMSAVPIGYVSVHRKSMAVSYHRIGSASPRADSTPPSTSLSLLQSSIVSPLTSLQPRCSSKYTIWTKAIANETPTVSFLLLKMDVTNPSSDLICDWHDPFPALADSCVLSGLLLSPRIKIALRHSHIVVIPFNVILYSFLLRRRLPPPPVASTNL